MKIFGDPKKREAATTEYAKKIEPDDTYRRPYSWTLLWRIGRPDLKSHDWVMRRRWEALAIEENYNAAFSIIIP